MDDIIVTTGLRTVFGRESKGYTTLLTDSRNEAVERLRDAARAKGANAVLAMRFDRNEIADIMSEVAAYGTAVTVRNIGATEDAARREFAAAVPPPPPHRPRSDVQARGNWESII